MFKNMIQATQNRFNDDSQAQSMKHWITIFVYLSSNMQTLFVL